MEKKSLLSWDRRPGFIIFPPGRTQPSTTCPMAGNVRLVHKKALDELVDPEASTTDMHTQGGKSEENAEGALAKDEEEKLLDRFRDPNHPLKFLIVTSKPQTALTRPFRR